MQRTWTDAVTSQLLNEPGRPRLTWYGPDDERIELSGAVALNWVNKTAGLLIDELDATGGTRVKVDLPMHWRTACWALAVWHIGACVVLGDGEADIVVTDHPEADHGGFQVAVALPALQRSFDGPLPPGTIDANATLSGQPDNLGPLPAPQSLAPALVNGNDVQRYQDLLTMASDRDSARVLLRASSTTTTADLLALTVLVQGGSIVVVDAASPMALTPQELTRLVELERVTRIEN